ncbi:hypothetical protein RND81_03G028000 [Saponaria officinalis]|uniref:CCHC-type domain-containing protein n=1 Tax=Saponaria officinalis TaxID=3572 RepID=A0AAW1LYC8_SAPOF
MASSSSTVPSVPIFVGENYDFWCIKMKALLCALDLWEIVEQGYMKNEPASGQILSADEQKLIKDKKMKDAKATAYLHSAIGSQKVRAIKLQNLRRDFENLRMKQSESMKDYTSRIMDLVNQMKVYGDDITDKRIVNKVLCSLDNKFNFIVTAIEESKDLDELSPQELFGSLQAHEQKVSDRSENSSEGAFQAKHKQRTQNFKNNKNKSMFKDKSNGTEKKGRFPPCGICKKTNHMEKNCWNKGKILCDICKKFGHKQEDCWHKDQQAKENVCDNGTFEDHLFIACQASLGSNKDVWQIDSGCTNHMTNNRSMFTDIDTSMNTPVRMGDGSTIEAKGKGTIAVQTKKGTRYIQNVLFVPSLASNLLSVPQMMQNGYSVSFERKSCNIYDQKGKEIAEIQMKNKSFPLLWKNPKEEMISQGCNGYIFSKNVLKYQLFSRNSKPWLKIKVDVK